MIRSGNFTRSDSPESSLDFSSARRRVDEQRSLFPLASFPRDTSFGLLLRTSFSGLLLRATFSGLLLLQNLALRVFLSSGEQVFAVVGIV